MKFEVIRGKGDSEVTVEDLNIGEGLEFIDTGNAVIRLTNTVYVKVYKSYGLKPEFYNGSGSSVSQRIGTGSATKLPDGSKLLITLGREF